LPAIEKRLDWDVQRLKDWAELGRYRDANATLAPPVEDEARVVFMGDSITDMWGPCRSSGNSFLESRTLIGESEDKPPRRWYCDSARM
jgi:hypothetical protein